MNFRPNPDEVRAANANTRSIGPISGRVAGLLLAGALLLLALAVGWHFRATDTAQTAAPPPPVNVARARLLNLTAEERTIGTVVPVAAVAVTAQVSGQLMSASFQEGQIVHRGDVLFRIDPRAFSAALQQAQAALARDKANAANAERDKARYLALLAVGATSKQQRDQAVATADADNAIVKSDEAAVAVAQLNLGYATIRSPITGKTGPILVQPGNLITANAATSPLVSITQIQPIKVSVSLPQADLPDIARQQREKKLSAVLRWQDGKTTTAPVTFVSNQVDARTGTIELRATFPNTDGRLVPGQLVETGITMNQYRNAVVVPRDAVNAGPAGRYVYVVTKSATAELREVTETYDDGTNAAIAGDVKAGDLVILQGQLRVQPGQQVSIANSGSISTAAGRQ